MSKRAYCAALAVSLLGAPLAWTPSAVAQGTPQASVGDAEIWLWRKATASGKPEDYQEYLRFYPDGRYAALAQLRVKSAGGPTAQTGAPPPAPASAPGPVRPFALPPELTLYHLDVEPASATAGQAVTVRTRGFLPPTLFDLVVLVAAGAPDFTPGGTLDESQFRVKGLATLYDFNAGVQIPAQPPGQYEVRYISRQYNPDGRLEVMARTGIAWR